MYDYRKLSEEEQKKILQQRKQRGYPLHAPPHPFDDYKRYHLWCSCVDHRPIFSEPADLSLLQDHVLSGFDERDIPCYAWVFLPDHYHALVEPENLENLGDILRIKHSKLATIINQKQNQKGRSVWNRYGERGVRNTDHFWATVNYLHHNPIRHEHVKSMTDWAWSSVHGYLKEHGERKMKNIWNCYPIDDYGKGWDWEEE